MIKSDYTQPTTKRGIYIPPHRRNTPIVAEQQLSASQQSARSYASAASTSAAHATSVLPRLGMEVLSSQAIENNRSLYFTRHATTRQLQRGITNQAIETTLGSGLSFTSEHSTTSISGVTKVVRGRNGNIITVIENTDITKHDVTRNTRDREQLLLKEVEKDNDHAMCELADIYASGDLGGKDIQKAYSLFIRAARLQNSHAMSKLASMYEDGQLGKPDLNEALIWWERAARRRNKYALYKMASYWLDKYSSSTGDFIDGINKTIIEQKIKEYVDIAIKKGGNAAMYLKASIHEHGYFGKIDLSKAVDFYIRAATGDTGSCLAPVLALQRLVVSGAISADRFEEILDNVVEIVARTNSEVAIELGLQQIDGNLGINPQRGFILLQSAAFNNNMEAILILAKCYREGRGCTIDEKLSLSWYNKAETLLLEASSKGNYKALWRLGQLYLNGSLGEFKIAQAEDAFIKVANNNDPIHLLALGRFYIEGFLGDRAPTMGHVWIAKAIEILSERGRNNDVIAIEKLIIVYLSKELGYKNYALAVKWLKTAAANPEYGNLSRAYRILGDIYSNPKRGEFDLVEAVFWYEKAATLENSLALFNLGVMHITGKIGKVNVPKAAECFDRAAKKSGIGIRKLLELKHSGVVLDEKTQTIVDFWEARLEAIASKKQAENIVAIESDREDHKFFNNQNDEELSTGTAESDEAEKLYKIGIAAKQKDLRLAAYQFRIAAKNGCVNACFELAELFSSGHMGEKARPVAMLFYKRAAKGGSIEATQRLVENYTSGDLSESNLVKAKKWSSKLKV